MPRRTSKRLIVVLILAGAITIGLGYGVFKFWKENKSLEAELEEHKHRASLLQRKYLEKNAMVGQLLRTKSILEGQKNAMQTELSQLHQEKESLMEERNALREKMKNLALSDEVEIKQLMQKYARLQEEHALLMKKHAKAVKDYTVEIQRLTSLVDDLEVNLRDTSQTLNRCESNNARLCILADELLKEYEDKGVFTSLLQHEPLTQVKKVELEKFIQEYKEKIEQTKLKQ
jgi:chromosome segregation ATPase